MSESKTATFVFKLYEIYDGHRDSFLWLLEDFNVRTYDEYEEKYGGASRERYHFVSVCGFFELSGVFVNRGLVNAGFYFEVFNPTPFWNKARPIIYGMRKKRPHIYENFELLNEKRMIWANRRRSKVRV